MVSARLFAAVAAVLVQPGWALTLGPVVVPPETQGSHVPPVRNVTLNYGVDGSPLVNVSLAMRRPTVLLEDIASIANVDCSADSVTVVFNETAAFSSAAAQWDRSGGIVLVTNHLGDCDEELERGFFIANNIEATNATLTIVASTAKTQLNETASYAEITFSTIPNPAALARRSVDWDPTLLNISDTLSLPGGTTLYKYDPYLTVTADRASISTAATLSGRLKFSVLKLKLEELYVDFDTTVTADLGVTVNVTAPYNTTATYTAPSLSYNLVDIPGILELGPALGFAIGVDVKASAAVAVSADVGAAINNGLVHVDFQNSSSSYASGWTPTYHATANITEKAVASVDPYVDVTVELACNILGGLLDLSIGLEAEPRFNNEFTLSATQTLDPATGVTQPTDSKCAQGLEITSEFAFALIAKVTQFWSDTIYSVTVPIVSGECYSWL